MNYLSEVETTDFTFDIDKLLQQNQNEITLASQESIAALPQLYFIFFWTQQQLPLLDANGHRRQRHLQLYRLLHLNCVDHEMLL